MESMVFFHFKVNFENKNQDFFSQTTEVGEIQQNQRISQYMMEKRHPAILTTV
jgi:hypothetical protein